MRMPTIFKRYKTAPTADATVLLGSDAASVLASPPLRGKDCILLCKSMSIVGAPVQRIAVGYTPPSGVTALNASVYLYDYNSGAWYAVGAPKALTPGRFTYFDVLAVVEALTTGVDSQPTSGGLEAAIVVDDGAVVAGTHVFVAGADLSVSL